MRMTQDANRRHIELEGVLNFRDLGGHPTRDGQAVVWRRLYRSGELQCMTKHDALRLKEEIGLKSVIDIRSAGEVKRQGIGLLPEVGARYYGVPFTGGKDTGSSEERFRMSSSMGEVYWLALQQTEMGKKIAEAMEIIADPENHPLVFHCTLGRDRNPRRNAVECPGRSR